MAPPLRQAWLGTVGYRHAWELQRRLAADRGAGRIDDCLLLLEHPAVYTTGRNTRPEHLGAGSMALRALGAEVHDVDRGGSVTFHGPGQLVAYPILDLAVAFPVAGAPRMGDVDRYLRALEAALCATAHRHGVAARRRPPDTGAWVGGEKLAAIGVKLAGGITTHGVAINVSTDLAWFGHVIPCGIENAGVTSLAACGVVASVRDVAAELATDLAAALGRDLDDPDLVLAEALAWRPAEPMACAAAV